MISHYLGISLYTLIVDVIKIISDVYFVFFECYLLDHPSILYLTYSDLFRHPVICS